MSYDSGVAVRRRQTKTAKSRIWFFAIVIALAAAVVLLFLPTWLPRLGGGVGVACALVIAALAWSERKKAILSGETREKSLQLKILDIARNNHTESMRTIEAFRVRTDEFKTQLLAIQQELELADLTVADLKEENAELISGVEKSKADLAAANEAQTELAATVSRLNNEIETIRSQIDRERADFTKASGQVAVLLSDNARLSSENLRIQKSMAELQAELDEASALVAELSPSARRGFAASAPISDAEVLPLRRRSIG